MLNQISSMLIVYIGIVTKVSASEICNPFADNTGNKLRGAWSGTMRQYTAVTSMLVQLTVASIIRWPSNSEEGPSSCRDRASFKLIM